MINLLKDTYVKVEQLKGPQLIKVALLVFFAFVPIGIAFGYFTNAILNNSENRTPPAGNQNTVSNDTSYDGRITFLDPHFYPNDEISYVLTGSDGKEIILLKTADQKLVVSEGHYAKVYGKVSRTLDNKRDVLIVDKIVINNATD